MRIAWLFLLLVSPLAVATPQPLSCDEAADKISRLEASGSSRSIEYQNFLTSVHHSPQSHSLVPRDDLRSSVTLYAIAADEVPRHQALFQTSVNIYQQLTTFIERDGSYFRLDNVDMEELMRVLLSSPMTSDQAKQLVAGTKLSQEQAREYQEMMLKPIRYVQRQGQEFSAAIRTDDNGQPGILFVWQDRCEPSDEAYHWTTHFNGENVPMVHYCAVSMNSETYSKAWPATAEGKALVIKEFKRKHWVETVLPAAGEAKAIKFWADGFTLAWNAVGGDGP
ncbi:hypothetical protein [Aliagarivorans marinus]|uniref:hypothetical protein n=1 Tax=Aliagarivorans marinus TaxID=561965 RepID=UPI00040DC6F3|nr:hypothetical protein [Aliagarivorans marinus]